MNHTPRFLSILAVSLTIPVAYAHDPAEHAKEAAAAKKGPDCAAMKDMDHSKMDPNDPVRQAMMAKCGKTADHSGMDHGATGKPAGTAAEPPHQGSH